MTVIKGSVNNHFELFNTIHNALVNNEWSVENREITTIEGSNFGDKNGHKYYNVIYKGVGFIEENPPYLMVEYFFNNEAKKCAVAFRGLIGYNKERDTTFNEQQGRFYISFDYQSINYHIVVNSRRICGYFRQNIVTQDFYAGFFLPLCKPTEYAYPFYISASQYNYNHNSNYALSFNHRSIEESSNSSIALETLRSDTSAVRVQGCIVTSDNLWFNLYDPDYNTTGYKFISFGVTHQDQRIVNFSSYSSNSYLDSNSYNFYKSFIVEDNLNMLERFYIYGSQKDKTPSILGSLDDIFMLYGEQQPDDIITLADDSQYKVCICNNNRFYFYAIPNNEV